MAEPGPGWLCIPSATRSAPAPLPSLVNDHGVFARPRHLLVTRGLSSQRGVDLVPHSPIATALVAAAALLLPCSLLAQQRRQSRLRKGTSLQRPPVVLTAVAQKRMTIYDLDAMDEDLPDGWDAIVDTESGFVYFAHETSNEVTWDWPTSNGKVKRPPPPPPPPP
mmetsp:Transcript_25068/g.62880  ORF Transcript_25068/g.62880 Transcript_25068/m.62880 type:complete len:165 (+) Transcript_25068:93-587(+)